MDATQNRGKTLKTVEEKLSLRDVLDIFLEHWKWFLISVLVCVGLTRCYLATKPWVYQRQAVMLVKDDGSAAGGRRSNISTDALMQLNGVMMGSSVKNEVYILQSYQLIQQVVRALHLDVFYSCKQGLLNVSLYDVKPFEARFLSPYQEPVTFNVEVLSASECRVSDVQIKNEKIPYNQVVRYGQVVNAPFGQLQLVVQPDNIKDFEGCRLKVSRVSEEIATNIYRAQVRTGEMDKESTLVKLVCTDTNIQRADDILAAILDAYKQNIIEDKNRIAQSTADFIDERIALISRELSQVEGELAQFKQNHRLVDLKQNSTAYIEQSRVARERSLQLESQLGVVQFLQDYLKGSSQGNDLIPSLAGVGDNGIQNQIAKYNELMLQRNRLAGNSGADSPTVKEFDQNLQQMRQSIIASMEGYQSSLKLQLRKAQQEEAGMLGTLSSVPEKEKQVLDIVRQQSIKETLYTYLLNKREETALQLAITEANIRVVEQPFGLRVPIAPRKGMISLAALLVGLILPFIYFQMKSLLNMSIRGRKDVETYTSIPVLGEIPHRKEGVSDNTIIVSEQGNDPITEAFRVLRFNMEFVKKDARVLMFTSTMPGEGKTFVSRNFAVTLGMTGKRVLLIDADIRKRTQSRLAGITHREGLTSYLSGAVNDVLPLIVQMQPEHHVDFLPAGIMPPNPAELLMSARLDECIAELKKVYDYIIIDNVPALIVADAGILNRVADMTLYVIRENKVDRRYLPELERLYQDKMFNHMCIVLNDSRVELRRYGYGYGYGHGPGYGYGQKKKR